ncbi:MAG TPA: hypothetical protein VIV54_15870 [Burkholderiales bacterium]
MKTPTPFEKPFVPDGGMKFADMTRAQKWIFSAKVVICVATFGYAFPNCQSD